MMSFCLLPFIFLKPNLNFDYKNFFFNKFNFLLIIFIIIYIILLLNYFDFKKYTVDDYWVGLGYIDKISKIVFSNLLLREYFTYFHF